MHKLLDKGKQPETLPFFIQKNMAAEMHKPCQQVSSLVTH